MGFNEKLVDYIEIIGKELEGYVEQKDSPEKNIYNAMRYSLMAGGKRLRPVLCLAVTELLGGSIRLALPFACAVEMIHTYSLIHDDLPCMDNDSLRRGKPTNHMVFGENMAVLAGDALLNYAFEIMLDSCEMEAEPLLQRRKVKAMKIIAEASGASGMIGGQVIDLESEGKMITKDELMYMHRCKTGALIKSCVMAAAVLSGADSSQLGHLKEYAENIGLAFQIKDDILDVEGDTSVLGKPIGSDSENKKSTFVSLYGLEESKKMLNEITSKALNSLDLFKERADFLKNLADYLIHREK